MQSQDERDKEGFAARRERDGIPKDFGDEITGKYEGDELEQLRAERPVDERLGRLEKKHDELKKDVEKKHDELKRDVAEVRGDVKKVSGQVSDLREKVSGAIGKIEGQAPVLSEMLSIVKKSAEREHVTFTAKVEVDKAQELAKVEVGKAHELAEIAVTKEEKVAVIEVTKEEKVDVVKAKGDRRRRNLKILALFASGGGIIEVLHQLGVL